MKAAIIFAFGIAVITSGCGTTGGGAAKPSSKAVYTDNIETMVGQKDIYIGHFGVTFVTRDKSSSKATSPMSRHSSASDYAQAVLTAKLSGVPESTKQAIADQAYANLVEQLNARGYNVRDYDELKAHERWARIRPLETPYSGNSLGNLLKREERRMSSYAPTDMSLLYGADMINPYDLTVIADETKIPVLAVNYTVHFAYFDEQSDYQINYIESVPMDGGASETLSASVELGQGIQVVSGSGFLFLVDQGGTFSDNGSVKLDDPVIVVGAYGENEDTTSGAQKAANTFSSVMGVFSGGSTESKEISIKANPEFYQFGVLKAIAETNARLTNALPQQN